MNARTFHTPIPDRERGQWGARNKSAEHGSEHLGPKLLPCTGSQMRGLDAGITRPPFAQQCGGFALNQSVRFRVPPLRFLPPPRYPFFRVLLSVQVCLTIFLTQKRCMCKKHRKYRQKTRFRTGLAGQKLLLFDL